MIYFQPCYALPGCKVTLSGGEVMECKILVGADGAYSKASTPFRQDRMGGLINRIESQIEAVEEPEWGVASAHSLPPLVL